MRWNLSSQVINGCTDWSKRMLNDFEMISHKFDNDEITIIPVSDVHFGALEHAKQEWEQFCKYIADTPNIYLILGGDLINNSIRSSVANPFDELYRPREQKTRMVEYLTPIKDRVLCAVSGNHERRSMKDDDVDLTYDIMTKLDIEHLYRESMAFVKIGLGQRSEKANRAETNFIFGVTHGAGGGIFTGAAVNRNERFGNIIEGLDCLIVGHTHKGTVSKPSKIVVDRRNEKISVKSYTVVSSVSWLNYGGYAMQKMLLPSKVSDPQQIIIGGNRNEKKLEVRW